jgi:hypothetical protein
MEKGGIQLIWTMSAKHLSYLSEINFASECKYVREKVRVREREQLEGP